MNKLGFAIKLASQGAGNAIECNRGQWTSKVVDIREYLKLFDGLQGTDNIVTFMSFDEGGCFLTLLRAISGRIGDFLSGWIYIPNTIEATGEDIMNAYNYVRNILSQSNLNDSIGDIEGFFSKEYSKKEYAVQYAPSSGEEFGVRFIDMYYSMKEILDADRYQPYYSNFKAIFLLDKSDEVKIAKEQVAKFKDFTKIPIEKTCIFKAPLPEEVRLLGRGAKIVFSTMQEFNSPVLTKKGDRIQLLALRDGFEPVILPVVTIQEDRQKCFIDPRIVKWKKRITPSMFKVYNHKHEKIEGVRISINGTDITSCQNVFLYEEDCRQATVKYSAPDYEAFEHKQNLLLDEYDEITLSRKVKSYQATVELANGSHAKMTLESKYLSSEYDSPLKGYGYDEDDRGKTILKLDSWFVWKQRLWGFLGGSIGLALIVLLLMTYTWVDNGCPRFWDNKENQSTATSASWGNESETEETEDKDISDLSDSSTIDDAIKYLDDNQTWTKSEMYKYPDLQGLFEDMNTFNLSRLLDYWYPKLEQSQNYKKVYESAKKTQTYGWNPKQDPHNPTYNKPGDEQINLKNYIYWLDQDRTPRSSSGDGGFHPNIGSNGGKNASTSSSSSGKSRTTGSSGTGKKNTTTNEGL